MVFKAPSNPNNSMALRGRMGWDSTGWECREHVPGRKQRQAAGDLVQVAHICATLTHCGHSSITATGTMCAGEENLHLLCPGCNPWTMGQPSVLGAPAALGDTSQLPGKLPLHSDP